MTDFLTEDDSQDFGFEIKLSSEMEERMRKIDKQLEKDYKEGKVKPPDSPFECVGCGS